MRLLFISNLFPDTREPYRGLDNATVLHQLADRWEIRAIGVRPALPWRRHDWQPREVDRAFAPRYVAAPYVPRVGSRVNPWLMARALRPLVREHGPWADVILVAWLFPDACAVAALAEEIGRPFAAIAQGSDVHQYLAVPARRAQMLRRLPQASAIITRSADLSRRLGEAGLERGRLHPIYNGIDQSLFQPGDRAAEKAALGLPADAPVVLFVGNFYPIKNPGVAIESLARLRAADGALRDTRLVMVGGGFMEADLRARADGLGVAEAVKWAGRCDAATVARWMRAADCLVLPSDNEGVPNVILESFSSGLPVVASRVGGIHEVHHEGAHGRLVPPRDVPALTAALREVLLHPPAAAEIAAHGRTFTWSRAAAAYHAVLTAACRS